MVDAVFPKGGDLIEGCHFKAALSEVFLLAAKVNVYFSDREPWRLVKDDRERAATVLYVCLQAISDLRILLAPFLPFSCQSLHEQLGFSGSLSAESANSDSEALLELSAPGNARWGHQELLSGVPLRPAIPLFKKLAHDTAAQELQRLSDS